MRFAGWGEWTLGVCSLTCGSGTLDKTRICLDYDENPVDNSECDGGASMTTDSCETQACPGKQDIFFNILTAVGS